MPTNSQIMQRPPAFAFIEMESPEDALKAIDGLNGASIGGEQIRAELGRERARREFAPSGRGGK